MKKLVFCLALLIPFKAMAQSTTTDIKLNELPAEVKTVLEEYVNLLRNSTSLEDAGKAFTKIAGGGLVNESATNVSLRSTVMDYSLNKDYSNIKFYAFPIQITRVNSPTTKSSQGFGESAIYGRVYKIWIGKMDANNGLPAPISILVPEGHSTITKPKVVNIGSL